MDDRRSQHDQEGGAVFAPARVPARGRPPILLATLALTVGALAGVGSLEGFDGSVPATAHETAAPATAHVAQRPRPTRSDRATFLSPPNLTPQLLALDLRAIGNHLFVHGDVFSLEAFVVVVSLEDQGIVTDTQTVNMPGGSTAFLTDANPRFHARFDMPRRAPAGSVWVRANAYDTHGDLILSLRQPVLPEAS